MLFLIKMMGNIKNIVFCIALLAVILVGIFSVSEMYGISYTSEKRVGDVVQDIGGSSAPIIKEASTTAVAQQTVSTPPITPTKLSTTSDSKIVSEKIAATPPQKSKISRINPGSTWQWQLQGDINTSYNVDLYDVDLVETPQSVINQLKNRGDIVICYFSAGSVESYRDDAEDFPSEAIGKTLDGWDQEKWLDVSKYQLFSPVMERRLDLAVQKGCDGVEPDNVDAFENKSGFALTYAHQLAYNRWLAQEAHERNLLIALKNDLSQVNDLVSYYDFAVNEQCFEYDECEFLGPFIQQGKAVLGVEYNLGTDDFCDDALKHKFSWLKMTYDLDGERISCN
jgi:hypothetical protein